MEPAIYPQRIQTLSQTPLQAIPAQFIHPPQNRPTHHPLSSTSTVPIFNLSLLTPQQLRQACRDWGAFQITGHGVPKMLLDDMRNGGLSFFNDFSMEEKQKYVCDPNVAASEGYGSRMLFKEDSVLDWRDYFDHHTLPVSRRNPNRWPSVYRGVVTEYSDHMKVLASRLLSMISESLNLSPSFIEDVIGEIYQSIVVNYYPPCPRPDLTLGLQSHSDHGAFTLIIQDDVGGLQVLKDGEWVTAEPISDAIVVLLADQTEIITNGQCRSAPHRAVTNAHKARLSVSTFHDPANSRKICPAAQFTTDDCPAQYREVIYGDYVSSWYTKGPEGRRNIDALKTFSENHSSLGP